MSTQNPQHADVRRISYKAGDYVEVRSREEILATLDPNGDLEKMPLMPEMLRYCGQKLKVASVAHKTCDTIGKTGGRKLERTVHLEGVRCDGAAHGGCQAGCLVFWKEQWLKRPSDAPVPVQKPGQCDEPRLLAATRKRDAEDTGEPIYRCQATELLAATEPLSGWNLWQYLQDWRSGNETLGRIAKALAFAVFHRLVQIGVGYRLLIKMYDRFQATVGGGCEYPFRPGLLPADAPTPTSSLDLQPGEVVQVKSHDDIRATLNINNKNRGLWFGAEMVPYCNHSYRVRNRVERLIDERTGKMREMKSPCIILEDVVCRSGFSTGRFLCPRAIFPYWRETWLRRAPGTTNAEGQPAPPRSTAG